MSRRPQVVAIEGPSDSGKTTLISGISRVLGGCVVSLPCFAEAFHGEQPPAVAVDVHSQLAALEAFIEVDKRRRAAVTDAYSVALADRCWLSLLAHVYAVERGGGPPAYAQARARLLDDPEILRPDLVIALRGTVESREGRMDPQDAGKWFTDPVFNEAFDQFLSDEAPSLCLRYRALDATGSSEDVLAAALKVLESEGFTSK